MKLKFDRFTLDTKTFQLRSGEKDIELEPKLFNILKLLLSHSDQVVSKEQLLEEVWDNRIITDNAMSRAIYEIRKVIDTPDSKESLIKTVRGRGFQINCPVTNFESSTATNGNKRTRIWLALFVAIVCVGMVSFWLVKLPSIQKEDKNKQSQNKLSLVILPLQTSGTDKNLVDLSHVIVDSLGNQLQSTLNIRVIPPESLISMSHWGENDLLAVQSNTKASHILKGYIATPTTGTTQLNLTLYRSVGRHELEPFDLGSFNLPWPTDNSNLQELYKQRKLIANEISKLIRPEFVVTERLPEASSPAAYRLFIAAHHAIRENTCIGINRAENLLKQAIEKDTHYADAWHKLMVVYIKKVWICGQSADNYQLALKAANQVEKLAPNQFTSIITAKNAILLENNQVEAAFEFVRNAGPKTPSSLYNKAADLRYAGFLQAGLKLENQILQMNPYFYSAEPISKAPYTYLYLNMFTEHLALLAEPGNSYHDYFRALNLFLTNKKQSAVSLLEVINNRNANGLFDQFARALLYSLKQQNNEGIKVLNQIVEQRQRQGHSDGEMTYKIAQLYAISKDQKQALQQLELSLKQGFFPFQYWLRDPAMDELKELPEFEKLVEKAKQRHLAFARKFGLPAEI